MEQKKKILLSGIKPTGRVHIGNYFGAMKQFVDLQDQHENFVFIPNYHAMTTVQDKDKLTKETLDVALDYLAIGLDPKKVNLYLQSDVPEVAELTWIFNCLTTVPYLSRAHAYKDALAKDVEPNVGVFDYPILMAADILIQDADIIPVGKDQKQHVEYARDIAEKFNRIFGDTFKMPEPLILESVETVKGTDGNKMSKSKGNIIPLFGTDEEIKKAVMVIPTDSKSVAEPKDPNECKVFYFHKLFSKEMLPEIERRYREGGLGYKESKDILIANIISFVKPLREKRDELAKDPAYVMNILKEGGMKAKKRAQEKMKIVREHTGIITTL
jgi:tryptophanyl-tRNA synthetase